MASAGQAGGVADQGQEEKDRDHALNGVLDAYVPEFAAVNAALDHPAQHGLAWLHHLVVEKLGNLGKFAAFAGHEFADPRRLCRTETLPPAEHGMPQKVHTAADETFELRISLFKAARDVVPDDGFELVKLAVKVEEDGAFRGTGPHRHFFHLRACKTFFHKPSAASSNSPGRSCLRRSRRGAVLGKVGMGWEEGILMTGGLLI